MSHQDVAATIRNRQTWKVLADVEAPREFSPEVSARGDQQVMDAIATAGWAPFHYDRAAGQIAEPWRVHVLGQDRCRALGRDFHTLFTDVKASNKLPSMLSACGSLVIVNWLPQFCSASDAGEMGYVGSHPTAMEKQRQVDEEHLAATAAFVQNLLLLLTAEGLGSYWSSGGQFRSPTAFEYLQIPAEERLLAAVFVDYDAACTQTERLAGKLRQSRAELTRWTRVLK